MRVFGRCGQGSLVRAQFLLHTGNTCNFRRISHEIIYSVILLYPLIQEWQLLVISESICTLDHFVLVNRLKGISLSARRRGWIEHLIASPEIIDRESDLLLHARDSRNPKPIPVMPRRCNLLISHKPIHSHAYSAMSMESQNLPSRDEIWLVSSGRWNDAFRGCI